LEGLLVYCQQQNVIRPAYSSLQDIVTTALRDERNRLVNKLYTGMMKITNYLLIYHQRSGMVSVPFRDK
jgi:hypothetical protein